MTNPSFKKALDTTSGTASIYGAPDIKYAFDVLDGSHSTDRIQASSIEHLTHAYDVVVYVSGSTIYCRRSGGTLLSSGTATTAADNVTVINAAFNVANTDGKAIVLIKPGTYVLNAALTIYNNTTLFAYGATFNCSSASAGTSIITGAATTGNRNIRLFGLTVDPANKGPIKFASTEANPASDITIRDCALRGNGADMLLYFQHTYPGSGQPTTKISNIRILNCEFDATGGSTDIEIVKIENATHAVIQGCVFSNTPGAKRAALSLYGACVDCAVMGNQFYNNNNSTQDLIINQSVNIRIIANEFANRFMIRDCRHIVVSANKIRTMLISDLEDATYDSHDSLIRGSEHINISGNLFNTVPALGPPQSGTATDNAITIDLANVGASGFPPKNISILGNLARVNKRFVQFATPSANNVQKNVERIMIANNSITEVVDAVSGNGIITFPDCTAGGGVWTNSGFKDIFITGNYFADSTGATTPHDIRLESTLFANVSIRANWFSNDGVQNVNSYTGVTKNHAGGGNDIATDSNSGISSGSTSPITVTHAVGYTPSLSNIELTPTTAWGSMTKFWISNPTSTTFDINMTPAPGQSVSFSWQVRRTN